MLRSLGIVTCATAITPTTTKADDAQASRSFRRVIDLTHTLSPSFPTPWKDPLVLEQISKLGKEKWNILRWHLNEHIGTHLDAPLHCTDLNSADQIPIENLVGPLVIVNIRSKASASPDSQVTLDDLAKWEIEHGPIPDGAVVAMFSGWDAHVNNSRKFLGLDEKGEYHLPGFHLEAVQFLHERRKVKGIATDTLNLDAAAAVDFPVHHYWLGQNKWGLENLANLGQLPPTGAMIVVGSPKIAGCTGGPSRVIALLA
jgi:kynurenine formamidase